VSHLTVLAKKFQTEQPFQEFAQSSHQKLTGPADAYRNALPDAERAAVAHYQGSGYHEINHKFRTTPNAAPSPTEAALDKALRGYAAPHDMQVIRNFKSDNLHKLGKASKLVGAVVEHPDYLSSSLHGDFGNYKNVSLRLNVPEGTKGLYLSGTSQDAKGNYNKGSGVAYEYEWLMPRRTKYLVHKVQKTDQRTIIYASVLPPDQQDTIP
jgi:hypothetical protein